MICWWVKNMFFSAGFRLKIKGIRASEKEAPILALAPHSSYYDALPVVVLTAPSIIVKAEVNEIPFFASMNLSTQSHCFTLLLLLLLLLLLVLLLLLLLLLVFSSLFFFSLSLCSAEIHL